MKIIFAIFLTVFLFPGTMQASEGHVPVHSGAASDHISETQIDEIRQLMDQWVGSSSCPDTAKASWATGLSTYLTSHIDAEERGRGWQYRKSVLIEYANYVRSGNEIPLREITQANDAVSEAIASKKGSMVFHMLRRITGDEVFFSAVKTLMTEQKFDQTSWDEIIVIFEKVGGKNLRWFFGQWLERKGMPEIEVTTPRVTVLNGVNTISFEILQKADPYTLPLQVRIDADKGEITRVLNIGKEKDAFEIPAEGTPHGIVFDGSYDIFRKLSDDERSPLISGLLGDEKKLLVVPENEPEKYNDLVNVLKKEGFAEKEESEIKDEDISTNSVLVFGFNNSILRRLFGKIGKPDSGFSLSVRRNPLNAAKVIAIAYAESKEEIPPFETIAHYRNYSSVGFRDGKETERTITETAQGLNFDLCEPISVIEPQKLMRIEQAIENILDKPVIYIGERHASYEDHKVQLKVIMSLHENGRKFAIGMEMFQRPFQKAIDDYFSGTISEKEFLKQTQYFKRWQFDYNLYREIIEYAKAKGIPVIALNLWTEIIRKVSAEGLDSLTDIERAELPDSMDMSDEEYRERLMEIFKQHKTLEDRSFENFYQAQILWDETMARSIDEFLRKTPDYQMVVLAGAGHVMYGSGIPKRAFRLNPREYVIVLPCIESVDEKIGDYLVSAQPVAPPMTLKMGLLLKEKNGYVEVEKVVPGSIAKSAGLKKGDILVSLDEWKIEDIGDVRIFMSDKKRGEKITIKVLRKRFLTGYKELVLTGTI